MNSTGSRSLSVLYGRSGSRTGFAAWLSNPMSQVPPSGGDFATAAVPTLPDAPARFSMIRFVPSRCWRQGWTSRAITSVEPPGGYGTTSLRVPAGQPCGLALGLAWGLLWALAARGAARGVVIAAGRMRGPVGWGTLIL